MTALYERIMSVHTHGACSYVTYTTAPSMIRAKTPKNDEIRPVRRLLRVRTAAAKVWRTPSNTESTSCEEAVCLALSAFSVSMTVMACTKRSTTHRNTTLTVSGMIMSGGAYIARFGFIE